MQVFTFTYSAGRLIRQVDPHGVSITLSYDTAGHVTSITDSEGGQTTQVYRGDLLVRQTFTNGTDELRLDISYDLAGREVSRTRSADLAGSILVGTTTSDYQGGLLSSLTHTGPTGATLAAYGYEYDAAGRVTQQTEGAVTTNYTYDATGQLIQAGAASYSFTANGNPTHGGAVPDTGNTLQSDGTWSYTYDAAGNVSTRHDATAGLTWTYTYDTINQLTHAVLTDTSSAVLVEAEYGYDAFGNRIRIEVTQGNTTTTTNAVFLAFRLRQIHPTGVEPVTYGSEDRCSIQLSYGCNTDHPIIPIPPRQRQTTPFSRDRTRP